PLAETASGAIARSALSEIQSLLPGRDALAVGPGLGTDEDAAAVVRSLLGGCRLPVVLDADALNIVAAGRPSRDGRARRAILTPHPGEAARLLGSSPAGVQADRPGAARGLATRFGCVAVLKGHRTLIAAPDGPVRVNASGNPGMATGGAGDALTGVAAAWL